MKQEMNWWKDLKLYYWKLLKNPIIAALLLIAITVTVCFLVPLWTGWPEPIQYIVTPEGMIPAKGGPMAELITIMFGTFWSSVIIGTTLTFAIKHKKR